MRYVHQFELIFSYRCIQNAVKVWSETKENGFVFFFSQLRVENKYYSFSLQQEACGLSFLFPMGKLIANYLDRAL